MYELSLLFATILYCLSLLSGPILGFSPSPAPSPTTDPQNLTNSLHRVVNAAIDEASYALNRIHLQLPKSSDDRERAAMSDCSEFYELTVMNLNKTLSLAYSTPFDVQIWLSAALTNIDNCKTSISEQNITPPIFLDSHKASELINDGLAINAEIIKDGGENLHRWFPDKDLQNWSEFRRSTTIVVAQDGSGRYRTIKEGLDASRGIHGRVVIHIKRGIYKEYLEIGQDMKNLFLLGDGIGKTIITGDRSAKSGFSTRESATVTVIGEGFVARGITFRNSAGVDAGQAVALRSSSDRSAYFQCGFEGYQDTLWVDSNRQLYEQCRIYGTIDFIFGGAAVVIQNSIIYARPPKHGQNVMITAQARDGPNESSGISIINCKIQPEPSRRQWHKKKKGGFRVFLGRPWRKYARTVYMKSYLDGIVDPAGWGDWSNKAENRTLTVYYAEYKNYGPGSSTIRRVKWKGFKVIKHLREAQQFTVANFIAGPHWLSKTGIPFSAGLL